MSGEQPSSPAAHQPTKAELEEDVGIDAAPEALAWAVTRGGATRGNAVNFAQQSNDEALKMADQLQKNWDAYQAAREKLEAEHLGQTALLHDGAVIATYNDNVDAYNIGLEKFGLGNFSIETIGEKPASLGALTMNLQSL